MTTRRNKADIENDAAIDDLYSKGDDTSLFAMQATGIFACDGPQTHRGYDENGNPKAGMTPGGLITHAGGRKVARDGCNAKSVVKALVKRGVLTVAEVTAILRKEDGTPSYATLLERIAASK